VLFYSAPYCSRQWHSAQIFQESGNTPKIPGWIEIRLEEGSATVVQNDKFPDRVGRKILKGLQADKSEQGLWHGLIYVEKLGEYKDVEVSLPETDRMLLTGKVGFFSRTVEWVRVDKIP